jgi:YegS/Rv2252/BmrU family lipid kinase
MKENHIQLPFYESESLKNKKQALNILLIINPVSGRMKTKTGLFEILDELYRLPSDEIIAKNNLRAGPASALQFPFGNLTATTLGGELNPDRRVTVVPTMYRGHAVQMASSASHEGFDTVICCGGDGTLNETISGLMSIPEDERPMLGYIPAGSTNDLAASIGLSSSLRGAARTAVGDIQMPLDIGYFKPVGAESYQSRFFSYIASFGAFTAASYSTSQTAKNIFGHVAYLLEGVKDLANLIPRRASFLLCDGKRLEGEFVFGAVTNTTSAGGVFKLPSDRVSMSDGLFELFLVHHPRNPADLNKIATALLSQDFDSCPLIELHHTKSVKVTLEENLSWSLDGEEAVAGTEIEISCIPSAVTIKVNE